MSGLHNYSRFRDSTGLRETFDHLGLVYHLQKHVQAKWFYIQSNTISRERRDTLNIIQSLIALASVKTDINDFEMAQRDLHEALALAKRTNGINGRIQVQKGIAKYYTKKGDAKDASVALNRVIYLKDSIAKADADKKQALIDEQYRQQRQAAASQLRQKQQLQSEEYRIKLLIQQKRGITAGAILIITAIVVLVFDRYLRRRRRKRRKKVG